MRKHLVFSRYFMAFFTAVVTFMQTGVLAVGAGFGLGGLINLFEGYGNDNPGAKSQGIKQLMAGGVIGLAGIVVVPLLSSVFTI